MPLVRLRGPLKELAGNRAEHAIEGDSVGELLLALERSHPATSGWILDERGALRRGKNESSASKGAKGRQLGSKGAKERQLALFDQRL